MAIAATTIWEIKAGSTANNVNGGGFNTANANMLADLTTDADTANTDDPIVSSASYNFVAGDVGNWVYIQAGTNWTVGFYKISAVAANKATLMAAVGEAVQLNTTYNRYRANTVAGCATVGTPTSGTFAIDYSQSTAAIIHSTDGTSTASTTFSSVTGGFTPVMVGNILHMLSATGADEIVGWYEVVDYTDANTLVLDRVSGTYTLADFYIGGAMSLNSTLDDDFHEAGIAGNIYFYTGSLTLAEAVSTALAATAVAPIEHIGYNAIRGDNPTPFGTSPTAPLINCGSASSFATGAYHTISYMRFTGSNTTVLGGGANGVNKYFKSTNTSATAARDAFNPGADGSSWNFETVCQNGEAIAMNGTNHRIIDFYSHDSRMGLLYNSSRQTAIRGLLTNNIGGISNTNGPTATCDHCTVHGFTTPTATSIGVNMEAGDNCHFNNSIFDGYVTLINQQTTQDKIARGQYNAFYNYTTLASLYNIDITDIVGTDPAYTDAGELSGTGATSSGAVITLTGADLSAIEDNVDYIWVVSATTATAMAYLITSHDDGADTVTVSPSPGTGSNIVWRIGTGHDYSLTSSL